MNRTKQIKPGMTFGILFVISAATLTALSAYLPEVFLNWWLSGTIVSTTMLGQLFGITITTVGEIMTVNGFAMRIITQCTALHYVIILSTAILLYTNHSIKYRLAGVAVSMLLVIAANAFRLVITGMVGSISWDAFVIVHDYLWVAAFSLLVLGIWIAWAERRFTVTQAMMRHVLIVLLTCTAVYGVLLIAMPLYGRFIAQSASLLFKTLINDPQATIIFNGKRMLYQYTGGELSASFTSDLMVVALYIGLILSAVKNRKTTAKWGVLGFVIILCITVAVIAGGGVLSVTSGTEVAVVFLWTAHGILLQLTLVWWLLRQISERTPPSVSLVTVSD